MKINLKDKLRALRQQKNVTQEALANHLGITPQSVGKWERGICLPDASLYEPLCNILDITINELFAGQKIKDEDYKKIADDNLMQMLKHKLYLLSDKSISFDEFDNALTQMANVTTELKAFKDKEEAVDYLMKETGCPFEECSNAYDFYIKLFDVN